MNNAAITLHFIKDDSPFPAFPETIGGRICKARKEQRMSIAELARRARVNRQNLSRMEKDERYPSIWSFIEIGRALGVSLDYLAGISNNP